MEIDLKGTSCITVVAIALLATRAWAGYTAVILDPPGYTPPLEARGIAGGRVVGFGSVGGGGSHAIAWDSTNGTFADLGSGQAWATDGGQIGGVGGASGEAALWDGPLHNYVDLRPPGKIGTAVSSVAGGEQVGVVQSPQHAAVWRGSAASFVDLHPAGFDSSFALATNGTQQAGWAHKDTTVTSNGYTHAILWSGTADSAIDLNPIGSLMSSQARAIWGNRQGGNVNGHASIWNGNAASVLDLNGSFDVSDVYGMGGEFQVGVARLPGFSSQNHAVVWTGSAGSVVDLHQYLPGAFTESSALGVDVDGNVAGYASDSNGEHAVVWLVPEPTASTLSVIVVVGMLQRWKRWRG